MNDLEQHPETPDPALEFALQEVLGAERQGQGLSDDGLARLLALTDSGMTSRLDAALACEVMPEGLSDRLGALIEQSDEALAAMPAAEGAVGAVAARIGPGVVAGTGMGWWRAAAMIGLVGGLVGLMVFGAVNSGGDADSDGLVVAPTDGSAGDSDPVVSTEDVALTLSEEFEALNGWLGSDASSSEGALDRQLSVFAARLATVDPLSGTAPLSPDEVAAAAAGDVELRDDLDLLEAYGEEWVF